MREREELVLNSIRILPGMEGLVLSAYRTTDLREVGEAVLNDMAGGSMTMLQKIDFVERLAHAVGLDIKAGASRRATAPDLYDFAPFRIEEEIDPAVEG